MSKVYAEAKKVKRAAEDAKRKKINEGLKTERAKRKHSEVTKHFRITIETYSYRLYLR